MLAGLRLRRFVVPVLVAVAFAGCARNGSVSTLPSGAPGAPRGVRDFVPQNVCVTTSAGNPATGSPMGIVCYLQPGATVTVPNISMEPSPGGGTCGTATWTAPLGGGQTGAAGITVAVTPTTTGAPATSCDRTDTVSMQVTTDSTLPNDFPDYQEHYDLKGTFCRVINGICETGWVEIGARVDLKPALHINDESLNRHVENTSVTMVAGQYFKLTVRSPDTEEYSDCHWTLPSAFPNDAVDGQELSDTSYNPTPSTFNLNQNYLAFWWIKPETQMAVTANCLIASGVRITANATYTMKEPTSSVTATYGSIGADLSYHLVHQDTGQCYTTAVATPYLHYGDPCATAGIHTPYTATADADEAGQIVMWQQIDVNRTKTTTGGTTTTDHPGHPCVDNQIEYQPHITLPASTSTTYTAEDSPAQGLDGYSSVHVNDVFDDYHMYKPNADNAGSSIWVALDHLQWSWDAQTALTGTSWAAPTINAQLSPANGTAYTDLPHWSCKFTNSVWKRKVI